MVLPSRNLLLLCVSIVVLLLHVANCKKSTGEKPKWAQKDIRDFNDADLERLYDQWEEDDEPLEEDELPEHLRKPKGIDMSQFDPSNPETILRASKKGKMLMTFVNVNTKSREETDKVTSLWQTSLLNNHIVAERFTIDDHRAIFTFKDGSQAWDAKDFFIQQDELESVTIENKPYYGKYAKNKPKEEL